MGNLTSISVRNSVLSLFKKIANFHLVRKRSTELRYVVNPRGVSSIHVLLTGVWRCLLKDVKNKARHFLFPHRKVDRVFQLTRGTEKGKGFDSSR